MHFGRVILFNDISGNGFIKSEERKGKVKVSYREIKRKGYKILIEGQKVEFERYKDKKGRTIAKNVHIINDA